MAVYTGTLPQHPAQEGSSTVCRRSVAAQTGDGSLTSQARLGYERLDDRELLRIVLYELGREGCNRKDWVGGSGMHASTAS